MKQIFVFLLFGCATALAFGGEGMAPVEGKAPVEANQVNAKKNARLPAKVLPRKERITDDGQEGHGFRPSDNRKTAEK